MQVLRGGAFAVSDRKGGGGFEVGSQDRYSLVQNQNLDAKVLSQSAQRPGSGAIARLIPSPGPNPQVVNNTVKDIIRRKLMSK